MTQEATAWETVWDTGPDTTDRLRVAGGWIYRNRVYDYLERGSFTETLVQVNYTTVFVPDPSR